MAGSVQTTPGFDLQPSAQQVPLATNYITNFDFLNQYLPDTYEKEFERYGNRTISSFLRMVGAEMPSNSDLIKWAEQGRLHTKYVNCTSPALASADTATFTINDTLVPNRATTIGTAGAIAIRVGQTVMLTPNAGSSATATSNKAIVTAVDTGLGTITVAFYEALGMTKALADVYTVFIYGSEFKKGQDGMQGSLEADDDIFETSPIILKDKYEVSGSDMAQIGWVEVTTENGATGYLWYLKSEHETRLRFDDYLETAMIEAVPAEAGSGVAAVASTSPVGNKGSEGIFYTVENRGNVWSGGNPATLVDFDNIIRRLDKQGSIEENVIFLNREFGFDIDDMLAAQNSYGAGGTSYGLFDNDKDMALNLGFTGFRRGYDFYKTDWKYLNDPTMRGGLVGDEVVNGLLVPAGSTTVYDQILGKGSAGGAMTSDKDAMEVHFLSERAVCTMGANNFFLFKD
jgi:hypothetical protein